MSTPRIDMRRMWRTAAVPAFWLTAGLSALAFADGPVPDPPVPTEGPARMASFDAAAEPDCRCGALRARDIESRIDGHIERWQALTRAALPAQRRGLHTKNLVEGVVGFPVRHYRLAADGGNGAGSR